MDKAWIAFGVVALALVLGGGRGEAQEPSESAWFCSSFSLTGLNVGARDGEDRQGSPAWDIRAVELPPGWEPFGVTQEGGAALIFACHPGPPRSTWGQHRLAVRP